MLKIAFKNLYIKFYKVWKLRNYTAIFKQNNIQTSINYQKFHAELKIFSYFLSKTEIFKF